MSSTNSKSLAARQRLHADLAVAELAVAAGLLLVAAVALGRGLDGLAVGDLGLLEVDLDLVALAQPAPPRPRRGAGPCPRAASRGSAASRRERSTGSSSIRRCRATRDLVLVAARLGLDGEGGGRLGVDHRRVDDGVRLVAQRVAGVRLLELGHRADVAGLDLRAPASGVLPCEQLAGGPRARRASRVALWTVRVRLAACPSRRGRALMRPAWGSAMVLKTKAEKGASGGGLARDLGLA